MLYVKKWQRNRWLASAFDRLAFLACTAVAPNFPVPDHYRAIQEKEASKQLGQQMKEIVRAESVVKVELLPKTRDYFWTSLQKNYGGSLGGLNATSTCADAIYCSS